MNRTRSRSRRHFQTMLKSLILNVTMNVCLAFLLFTWLQTRHVSAGASVAGHNASVNGPEIDLNNDTTQSGVLQFAKGNRDNDTSSGGLDLNNGTRSGCPEIDLNNNTTIDLNNDTGSGCPEKDLNIDTQSGGHPTVNGSQDNDTSSGGLDLNNGTGRGCPEIDLNNNTTKDLNNDTGSGCPEINLNNNTRPDLNNNTRPDLNNDTRSNCSEIDLNDTSNGCPEQNNDTKNDTKNDPESLDMKMLIFQVAEAFNSVLIVLVNGMVLIIMLQTQSRNLRHNNVYFVNLCAADLCVGLAVPGLTVASEVYKQPDEFYGCVVSNNIISTLLTASILSCCCISVDRLIIVKYTKTRFKTLGCQYKTVALIWLASFLQGMVWPALWHQPRERFDEGGCQYRNVVRVEYNVYGTFASVFVPVTLCMLVVNVLIFKKFRKSENRLLNHQQEQPGLQAITYLEMVDPAIIEWGGLNITMNDLGKMRVPVEQMLQMMNVWQTNPKVREKELRLVKSLSLIFALFILAWAPLHALNIIELVDPDLLFVQLGMDAYTSLRFAALALNHFNSFINTVVYCLYKEELRRKVVDMLLCLLTCGLSRLIARCWGATSEKSLAIRRLSRLSKNKEDEWKVPVVAADSTEKTALGRLVTGPAAGVQIPSQQQLGHELKLDGLNPKEIPSRSVSQQQQLGNELKLDRLKPRESSVDLLGSGGHDSGENKLGHALKLGRLKPRESSVDLLASGGQFAGESRRGSEQPRAKSMLYVAEDGSPSQSNQPAGKELFTLISTLGGRRQESMVDLPKHEGSSTDVRHSPGGLHATRTGTSKMSLQERISRDVRSVLVSPSGTVLVSPRLDHLRKNTVFEPHFQDVRGSTTDLAKHEGTSTDIRHSPGELHATRTGTSKMSLQERISRDVRSVLVSPSGTVLVSPRLDHLRKNTVFEPHFEEVPGSSTDLAKNTFAAAPEAMSSFSPMWGNVSSQIFKPGRKPSKDSTGTDAK